MDFPVALTVLASCRTAAGSDRAGRGLSTLSGAFLAAGSNAVVVTLWEIGDETTAAIMQQFYFFLARGDRPVEALRNAKLRLMADPRWNRPELWSGYVLIGESPPVAASRRGKGIALFLSVGVFLGVLLWALRLSRRLRTSAAPS